MPPTNLELPTTSVLLIDGSANDRMFYADRLWRCSSDYVVLEDADGPSGRDIYQSRRIDCVVLELELPNQSGFEILINLVPIAAGRTSL